MKFKEFTAEVERIDQQTRVLSGSFHKYVSSLTKADDDTITFACLLLPKYVHTRIQR